MICKKINTNLYIIDYMDYYEKINTTKEDVDTLVSKGDKEIINSMIPYVINWFYNVWFDLLQGTIELG